MVDDFMVVCVDRIIAASACFESASNGASKSIEAAATTTTGNNKNDEVEGIVDNGVKSNGEEEEEEEEEEEKESSSFKKVTTEMMVECRICQEEDDVLSLEAPCACNGSLKFAHRKCIQKWCIKKGNITCEICNQVFSPNYSLPLVRSNPEVMSIDIRQAWAQQIDLHDSHLLALAAAERHLLESGYEDYAVANTSIIACLRLVALILLMVLLLHLALMTTRDSGTVQELSTFFNVYFLQFVGFLLPCYVMARSCYMMQSRRRRHLDS